MRLTVIGCAGSFPRADSPASCYLVEHDGFRLLLDMGNGSLGALQRHVAPTDVDAVLVSHLHTDHCVDLCSLDVYLRYHPDGRRPSVPVYGPAGLAERIRAAAGEGSDLALDFIELVPGRAAIGPFSITIARMAHPGIAYGYRITADGRTLVYSGDTGPTPALRELAAGADVALFEASFRAADTNPSDLHLTGAQAAEAAVAAAVPRLVLTHLVGWFEPGYALADAAAHPQVCLATAGMVVDV
jgi:ribonuclease BN (tRNA processing enzyme)